MTYEQLLALAPTTSMAGDRKAAQRFVDVLTSALQTQTDAFTDSQKRYIYRLRLRWQTRADGKDINWNANGSAPGRPMKEKAKVGSRSIAAKAWRRYERENTDPLLAAIIDKFGTPPEDEFRHLRYPTTARPPAKKGGK